MDIMISSNFERLLFDLYDRDGAAIAGLMADAKAGHMDLSDKALGQARELFSSYRCDNEGMLNIIRDTYADCDYLLDPHTAIGLEAARQCRSNSSTPMVTLATAHPAKFPDAVRQAGYPQDPELPPHMADLFEREERFTVLDNDQAAVQQFIAEHISA
jgi:threonine synthase